VSIRLIDEDDPALILYTSGTTSMPRGAILTHEAFVRVWMASGRVFRTTPQDKHFNVLPLFHVAALGAMTWVIGRGATFVTDYSWDAGRALARMQAEGEAANVEWITARQGWAVPVCLEAGLRFTTNAGPVLTGGDVGPFQPYLPSGSYL